MPKSAYLQSAIFLILTAVVVRYPSYAGAILLILGSGVALGSWIAAALIVMRPGAAGGYYRVSGEADQATDQRVVTSIKA